MKKVAVLLDGGLVLRALYRLLGERHPTAGDVWGFAQACVRGDEELFRIYFYDCPPYEGRQKNPVSPEMVEFSDSRTARRKRKLHQQLALMDYVAMREGELSFNGWVLTRGTAGELIEEQRPIRPEDLRPDLEQKRNANEIRDVDFPPKQPLLDSCST